MQLQDILNEKCRTKWFFAFGAPQKTSLSITYCRQNGFDYFSNPTIDKLKQSQKNAIIQGSLQLFNQLQKYTPQLYVIFFGKQFTNENEKRIRKQYQSIGRCKDVPVLDHAACRKALYPNLIFVYGPNKQQNHLAAKTLAFNLQYQYAQLPKNPNQFITHFSKINNYIINGSFVNANQILILEEYFNIRIIHFKYNREDLPKLTQFFDEQHDLFPVLKGKNYYIPVKGDDDPVLIMDNVGVGLCPRLIYINYDKNQKAEYVNQYIKETDGLMLSIYDIQSILKRKGMPLVKNFQQKIQLLNKILYKDLNRKQVLFTDFPWHTPQFIEFENINRRFTYFIDLTDPKKYQFSKQFSSPIYFLQNQRRICPSFDLTLKEQLNQQNQYWVVNGSGTCGKTSVAKYIASQFGFKLIQFQTQAAAAKQKIASPEDGDQVPVKKYIGYFANIVKNNPKNTYIFDALPYTGADLQLWVKQVGCPNVINLKAQPTQLIKRARKKAQSDVNAEVTQQQTAKTNENIQKNNEWVQKLGEYGPSSKIYQVDYSQPQLLSQIHINSILKPRIYLVQRNNWLTYQNIAIKYDMGFVNLARVPLRQSKDIVRKFNKRDVILCYYGQTDERLVSEDLYWIEKNLGQIRYLGIWQPEQTQIRQNLMHLQRPPAPVKPKPVQGEQAKQQQPPVEQQQGKPKKVFDIYEHQWTQPVSHKNLSQWFFKLKKKIIQRSNQPITCFQTFHQVFDGLNNDRNCNFYQRIL